MLLKKMLIKPQKKQVKKMKKQKIKIINDDYYNINNKYIF